ncbi:HD domain-containing phosphohydrolase [Kushneria aurantia]|uniref:HD domain-containing phosphohydrolase n=1 Tax=Kushneria aurantia TaxID=504092 RepID=A0ABV6G8A7_9GAMM|nr:HD domain-containing phosphohydrolase [Kushneria aurantia]
MNTLAQPHGPVVEIDDTVHIAEVVENLDSRLHALSITLDDAELDYPAVLVAIDRRESTLTLNVTDAGSLDAEQLVGTALVLHAESERNLSFDTFTVLEANRQQESLQLRCNLPQRLHAMARRQSVRIVLRDDMPVEAALTRFAAQSTLKARLHNISLGGCLLKLPLATCDELRENATLSELTLTFPNGTRLTTPARICHINPVGRSLQAAMGVQFTGASRAFEQQLLAIVSQTEREIAWRRGEGVRLTAPSTLYTLPGSAQRARVERHRYRQRPPMLDKLQQVARKQHLFLLALQNGRPLPTSRLHTIAEQLLALLQQDRQRCLFALSCLRGEPDWLRHCLGVALRLADLMLAEGYDAKTVLKAITAALIHDMGKVLLIDDTLPSLHGAMSSAQRQRIHGHVGVLISALERSGYPLCELQREIITTINERLDGSGYPAGLRAEALSPMARMAAVIDTIDAMTRRRSDRDTFTAVEAYRHLYNLPQRFDRHWLTRYIQRQGFYPVASLVKFANGYLAWVMALDERGQPSRVRVVKNVHRRDINFNDELGRSDFCQLGELLGAVSPSQYDL